MIYVYAEDSGWADHFALACGRQGLECQFFEEFQEVPPGSLAFVRLDQRQERRDAGKTLIRNLHNNGVKTFPNPFEAELYDDKLAQWRVLKGWMPKTYLLGTPEEGVSLIKKLSYPILSKSRDGASSHSVRLLGNYGEALKEIKDAFAGGIPSVYGRTQKGYLYWQEFLPGNNGDIRVVIANDRLFGLKRYNRVHLPFASGSGNNEPILELDEKTEKAFALAAEISRVLQTSWMAYDFVFDGETPKVLEMSSSWTAMPYRHARMFDLALNPTEQYGGHMFDCAAQYIKKLGELHGGSVREHPQKEEANRPGVEGEDEETWG